MTEVNNYQIFNLGYDTRFKTILITNDSTIIIGITKRALYNSEHTATLMDLDLEGNIRWQVDYACGDGCKRFIQHVISTSDGGYLITCSELINFNGPSTFINYVHGTYIKVDSLGNEQWTITPNDPDLYLLSSGGAVELDDGTIMIAYSNHETYNITVNGTSNTLVNDSATVILDKVDYNTGELISRVSFEDNIPLSIWDDSKGYPYQTTDIIHTLDGNLLVIGTTNLGGFLLKVSKEGEFIWFREHYPSSTKNYFAIESYYMYKEFQQEQTQVIDIVSNGWFGTKRIHATDLFMIKRSYIAFAPKLGYQKQYESGFLLDCYLGIGLRFIDTEIYSINGILEDYVPYEEILSYGFGPNFDFYGEHERKARYHFEPRKFTEIYFPLNFKIGYVF